MRRLALPIAGATLWLLLAAVPVFADGGPHVMTTNNGAGPSGLTADSCAGCHRAHTSQSPTGYLLTSNAPTVTEFCLSCHGSAGAGATTDVMLGIQFRVANPQSGPAQDATDATVVLGALRGGGFDTARIGSASAYRTLTWQLGHDGVTYEAGTSNSRIPVLSAGQPVTSAHLALPENGLTAANIAWGNGSNNTSPDPGGTVTGMECTSCHNPHGNGNYRILESVPKPETDTNSTFTPGTAAAVTDDTSHTGVGDQTRNYTVIQVVPGKATANGAAASGTRLLTAKQVADLADADLAGNYGPLSGDYFHKAGQYNTSGSGTYDAPNGLYATFYSQMSAWCETCHARYDANHQTGTASGDATFNYKHTSNASSRFCLTCHVSHGSNAVMNTNATTGTTFSSDTPFPNDVIRAGDSRLLKVNGRGTCLLCHDPTKGSAIAPAPSPGQSINQGTTPLYFP